VQDVARFRYEVATSGPGAPFRAVVVRDGERREVTGTLGSADRTAAEVGELTSGARLEALTDAIRQEADLPPRVRGVYVRDPGDGPLARAGVHAGDVILDANQTPVDAPADLARLLESGAPQLLLRLYHQGDVRFVVVQAGR
jgi:serine protease Do